MERVAGEHDPRLERDAVPLQPVRVAHPVEALVAATDDLADLGQLLDRPEDALAEDRMGLDDRPFLVGERPWLGEDRRGDADLADVVEERSELEALQGPRFETERLADLEREVGDPACMGRDVRVACLERVRERLDRRQERALEALVVEGVLKGELRLPREPAEELELALARASRLGGVAAAMTPQRPSTVKGAIAKRPSVSRGGDAIAA